MKITDLAAHRALDRVANKGFDAVSDTDQTVAAVWVFDAGISNSGLARFLASKRGNMAFHAPTALRKIGATELAEIAAEANTLFGPAGPPADQKTRRALVRAFDAGKRRTIEQLEKRYYASTEDVDDLLEAFLNRVGAE